MKKFFALSALALVAGSAFAGNYALKVTCAEAKANPWDSQVFINFPAPVEAGVNYTVLMDVMGSVNFEPREGQWGPEAIQPIVQDNNSANRDEWGGPADLQYLSHFTVTTEWVKDVLDCNGNPIVTDGNFPYSRLLLNLGLFAGDIYVDNVRMVAADGTEAFCITFDTEEEQALVENGWMNLPKEFVEVAADEPEPEFAMSAEFQCGEDAVALNSHSAVSVESAEALVVNFENGPMIMNATYAIDKLEEEDVISIASGALSVNTVGYVAFDQPLVFLAGNQYKLTVKAWDTPEMLDENLNVVEPYAVEEYVFNGASAMGIIGEAVWGIDRHELPEDMINLGIKVTFPELALPYGIAPEDCEITVSASLFGIPEGNEPMPINEDDDIDPGFGVDGPVVLAEAVLHNAFVEGGVVTAYLFAENENIEVGNHYAVQINAVTVISESEIVAELPEDAYYATDFVVTAVEPEVYVGAPVFGIEGNVFPEDMINLGVPVSFPDLLLPAEDCDVVVSASLYGIPAGNEPMPLSEDDDVDPGMGVDGPVCLAEAELFHANTEGVVTAYLFPEMLEVGNHYAIIVNAVTVWKGEEMIAELEEGYYASEEFEVVGYEPEPELEFEVALINGEEEIALNSHSAVSVESADAIAVNFVNGPMVKYATYAIDKMVQEEFEGETYTAYESVASGALSISSVGYAAFEAGSVDFVMGNQYMVVVKAWDVEEIFDENWNMAEPIKVDTLYFNGAADVVTVGEPVWGIERGEFESDMIALGVPVSFPELQLPFGVVAEESAIVVYATLAEEGAELEDDDFGFGVNSQYFFGNVEGGVVTAYLFPEQLEVGKTYTIVLTGIQFYDLDLEEMLAGAEIESVVTFTVVKSEGGEVSINGIAAENGKVMFNIFGQKVNNANGVVIVNGQKALVK